MNWYVCIGRASQRMSLQPCFFLLVNGSLAGRGQKHLGTAVSRGGLVGLEVAGTNQSRSALSNWSRTALHRTAPRNCITGRKDRKRHRQNRKQTRTNT